MKSDKKEYGSLNWFNPYAKWEFFTHCNKNKECVEESILISPEVYKIEYLLNDIQEIQVETKIEGSQLVIMLYRKQEPSLYSLNIQKDIYQLFYRKAIFISPGMITNKIKSIHKENLLIIEIPRKFEYSTTKNCPYTINSFKESYNG